MVKIISRFYARLDYAVGITAYAVEKNIPDLPKYV